MYAGLIRHNKSYGTKNTLDFLLYCRSNLNARQSYSLLRHRNHTKAGNLGFLIEKIIGLLLCGFDRGFGIVLINRNIIHSHLILGRGRRGNGRIHGVPVKKQLMRD